MLQSAEKSLLNHRHHVFVNYSSLLLPVSKRMDLDSLISWAPNQRYHWQMEKNYIGLSRRYPISCSLSTLFLCTILALRSQGQRVQWFIVSLWSHCSICFIFCNWPLTSRHSPAPYNVLVHCSMVCTLWKTRSSWCPPFPCCSVWAAASLPVCPMLPRKPINQSCSPEKALWHHGLLLKCFHRF